MPLFNFPNKVSEKLRPAVKEAEKLAKYDKEKDPVYQNVKKRFEDFIKKHSK